MKQHNLTGRVVDSHGFPISLRIAVAAPGLCGCETVGEGASDPDGRFALSLTPTSACRLTVRLSHEGRPIATREVVVRGERTELAIQLAPAEDPYTEYDRALAVFVRQLGDTDADKLCPDSLDYLASEAGLPVLWGQAMWTAIRIAGVRGAKELAGLACDPLLQALYALARVNPTASAKALLGGGPAAWRRDLARGAAWRYIPALGCEALERAIEALRALAVKEHAKPAEPGELPVGELLATAAVGAKARRAFLERYVEHGGALDAALEEMDGDAATELRATFAGARLAGEHPPLLAALQAERRAQKASGWRHLAAKSTADWHAVVSTAGLPAGLPGADDEAKRRSFVGLIEQRVERAYPAAALAAALRRSPADGEDEAAVLAALEAPDGEEMIAGPAGGAAPPGPVRALKRVRTMTSKADETVAIYRAGYRSASAVKAAGKQGFIASVAYRIPQARAADIYRTAERQTAIAEAALLRLHDRIAAEVPAAIGERGQSAAYRDLFGTVDRCACEHCASLLGPAAYLVDILAYLGGLDGGRPLARLLARRPDLEHIHLDCTSSHTVLPYIDLVNEILEHAVAGGAVERQTTWTQAELAAHPEHLARAAYDRLRDPERLHPWRLPFDLWDEEARAYLRAIGVPRHRLLALGGAEDARVVAERLGLGALEAAILAGASGHPVWRFWARDRADEGLRSVAELLRLARLTYRELAALGETGFVGDLAISGAATCDTARMRLGVADLAGTLDRIHRFVRLQRRLGWSTGELDRAIERFGGGQLDAALLPAVADARDLAAELAWPIARVLELFEGGGTRGRAMLAAAMALSGEQLASFEALCGSPATRSPGETIELLRRVQRVRSSGAPAEVWHHVIGADPAAGAVAAPEPATIARHLDELRRELQPLDAAARPHALAELLGTALPLAVPVLEDLLARHPALGAAFLAPAFVDSPRGESPSDGGVHAPAFAAYRALHRAAAAIRALAVTADQIAWLFAAAPPPAAERFLAISPPGAAAELAGWGLDEATVRRWAAPPSFELADEIKRHVRARLTDAEWAATGKRTRDPLRELQAAALVDHLLASPPPPGAPEWRDAFDVYAYYLVDPEMSACAQTSRIRLAHGSVQLFVQRCLLRLEDGIVADAAREEDWRQWEWRKTYRLWEAARRIVLHPENYILHELLDRKTPLFVELEKQLDQDELTDETAEAALRRYIDGLQEIANLEIAATTIEREGNGKEIVHVIGRTHGVPRRHYYRQRVAGDHATWWTAWEQIPVDIDGDSLVVAIWNRKLWLFWAHLVEKQDAPGSFTMPKTGDPIAAPGPRYQELRLAWCRKTSAGWSDKALCDESVRMPVDSMLRLRATLDRDELMIDCDPKAAGPNAQPARFRFEDAAGPVRVSRDGAWLYTPRNWTPLRGGFLTESAQVELVRGWQHMLMDVVPDASRWEWRQVLPNAADPATATELFAADGRRSFFLDWEVPEETLRALRELLAEDNILVFAFVALGAAGQVRYRAELVSHPFAALLARELERDGLRALFDRRLQLDPWRAAGSPPVTFASSYTIGERLVPPYPLIDLDFSEAAAFSQYHWELFFHAPMLIAERLSRNQRFAEAQRWFHRVFDPTDASAEDRPQRYWITRPFFELQRDGQTDRAIEQLADPATAQPELHRQVEAWEDDPFSPHRVARMRPVAYMKSVFMKYIDNLIAWADALFREDTIERINEAMQLYVLAAELLGPRPQEITGTRAGAPARSFAQIRRGMDALSNAALERIEDRVRPRGKAKGGFLAGASTKWRPKLGGYAAFLPLFCFPANDKLLGYWDVLADRFLKIRHCRNIDGVERQLALFEPPIDPALLVRAHELGVDLRDALTGAAAGTPHQRFTVLAQHASQLCQETRGLGAVLLAALEKRDAEELARLRAHQEAQVLDVVRASRERQVDEAKEARDAILRSRDSATRRRDYYASRDFMNAAETAQQALLGQAMTLEIAAGGLDLVGNILQLIPDIKVGAPFSMGATFGGNNLGPAVRAFAAYARSHASVAGTQAQMAGALGGYQRRMEDWGLQKDLAEDDLHQLDHQLAAAELRLAIARNELAAFERQRAHAEQTEATLRGKYTNRELYDWMVGQISAVHFQCYQLAYEACLRAARAFRYETQSEQEYIRPGYWDSLRSGLIAGEKLAFDLKRMEAAHLEQSRRDFEITKHISLAEIDPIALLALRRRGECYVTLGEHIFERDLPGHYMRRIRSLGISIASVAGPYTGVNATVSLERSSLRAAPGDRPDDLVPVIAPVSSMVASSGRDDVGVFEASLRDERLLPFEGAGAISQWRVQLPEVRSFDYDTISDVIFHLRYTARPGAAPPPAPPPMHEADRRLVMLEVRQQFPTAWHRFLHAPAAGEHTLELALGARHVPYRVRASLQISRFDLLLSMTETPTTLPSVSLVLPGGASIAGRQVEASEVDGIVHAAFEIPNVPVGDDAPWRVIATALDPAVIEDAFVILTYRLPA